MYKHLLGMNVNYQHGIPVEEQIPMLRKIGFESLFSEWNKEFPIDKWVKLARENGMIYQSLHAPFGGVAKIWHGSDEEAAVPIKEITDCIHSCSDNEIELAISHCYIGFDDRVEMTQAGLERFGKIIDEAQKCGVKIAFENTEGLEYLAYLLEQFGDRDNVGFCLDTGHEMCYNRSEDLLARWGDKLLGTHINDNLGIRDYGGDTIWHDDLHLLPFDGIGDWDNFAERINKCGYDGILTFELCRLSKPDRHENDKYMRISAEEYFTEAYMRACRVAAKIK